MILSMYIYCIYIGCFLVATLFPSIKSVSAISGAAIGGIGAGFLWTAQVSRISLIFLPLPFEKTALYDNHFKRYRSVSILTLAFNNL